MTTPVIDPSTGLPQLPEGHFWKVRAQTEGQYGIDYYRYQIPTGYYEVVWMVPNPNGTKTVSGPSKWWKFWETSHNIPSTEPKERRRGTIYTTIQGERVKATDLDKSEILDAAIRVFNFYQKDQQTKDLLGDYPPKTIN